MRQDSRAQGLVKQESRNRGLVKKESMNRGLEKQDSRIRGLVKQDSRSGGLRQHNLRDEEQSDNCCSVHGDDGHHHDPVEQGKGGSLWQSLQTKTLPRQNSRPLQRQESRTLPRQDSRGVRRQDSVRTLPRQDSARTLPRQDSARTLPRQDSARSLRPVEREPYVDKARWKDTLRSAPCAAHKETHRRNSEVEFLSPARRCRSSSSSPGRGGDWEYTREQSPPQPHTQLRRRSPSRTPSPSPPLELAFTGGSTVRGEVGEGGNPCGDYVPFAKFQATRTSDIGNVNTPSPWTKKNTDSHNSSFSSYRGLDSGLGSWSSSARESSTSPKSSVSGTSGLAFK